MGRETETLAQMVERMVSERLEGGPHKHKPSCVCWYCRDDIERVSLAVARAAEKRERDAIDEFQRQVSKWAEDTFPGSHIGSRMAHLRDELNEVESNPGDSFEWADVLLLFMHAAVQAGHSMTGILSAARAKHKINLERVWGEPDERGVVRHIAAALRGRGEG